MRTDYHFQFKFSFDIITKISDIRAGRIANHQAGCQVDHLCAVLDHFVSSVLDVAARAAVASGIPYNFYFHTLMAVV